MSGEQTIHAKRRPRRGRQRIETQMLSHVVMARASDVKVSLVNMTHNQTLLSTINDMILSLECSCGHRASIRIAELLPKMPEETSVQDVIDRAKCRVCGAYGSGTVLYARIVYENLSDDRR